MAKSVPGHAIRNATMKDAGRIIELLAELGRPAPKRNEINHFARVIQKYVSDRDKIILVAEIDSKVVGIISLVFLPRLNRTRPEAWVPDLIVDNEYRNRGIGRALLEKCVRMARRKQCWRIRLETGLSRKSSQEFYELMRMKPFALSFMSSL